MKKIISAAVLIASLSATAFAQTMYDGLKYSDINYFGTARSIALGNAMTAVGGDLGSIVLNPAGSSVAGYSQFSFTQGVSRASTGSDFSKIAGSDVFEPTYSADKGRYTMPNVGFVMNFNTPASSSVKSYSIGMIVSTTNRSLDKMVSTGRNDMTSMTGAAAYFAGGIPFEDMDSDSAYDNYYWPNVLAYKSYMISGISGSGDKYIGATEADEAGNVVLAGPVDQRYVMQHTGSRNDMVFNVAANFSDMFYLGFNLGMPILTYKEDIFQCETAVNPSDFEQVVNEKTVYFQQTSQRYYLNTDGSGVYAQIGAIVLPFDGLRLGLSIKTPTYYNIRERWGYDAQTVYDTFSQSASSPEGDYRYDLVTPWETNLGVAYTLGGRLLVSWDWGSVNYKSMRFRSADEDPYYSDEFDDVNDDINRFAGKARQHRLGVEYRILPSLSLRYGYNSKTYEASGTKDRTRSNAFGIGYSSNGSFFADFAVRNTKYPYQWYYPYDDYMYDDAGVLSVRSNEVGYSKSMFDCLLTLGWRF